MPQEPDFSKFEPIAHDTTAVPPAGIVRLPIAKASNSFLAEVICENASIRYWKDTSSIDPDAQRGILVGAGERFYLWSIEIPAFRAIAVGDFNAQLQTTFYMRRSGLRSLESA